MRVGWSTRGVARHSVLRTLAFGRKEPHGGRGPPTLASIGGRGIMRGGARRTVWRCLARKGGYGERSARYPAAVPHRVSMGELSESPGNACPAG